MSPLAFAFISYLGWAVGDIFGTVAARKLDAYSVTFWSYILRLIAFGLYIPFAFTELSNLTANILTLNIALGVLLLIGFIAFNESLRSTNPSLAGTIAASFSALVVVFSIVFLKESLTPIQALAILIIFAGLILSTLDLNEIMNRNFKIDRGVVFALVAMLMWGMYFTFIKIPVKQIGWFWPNYISFMLFPLIFLFMKSRRLQLKKVNQNIAFKPLLASALLTGVAEFSYNSGIDQGLTAIVAPIAGSYPTLFVILAFLVFKDPIKKQQILGIITTLAGIVLLSLFTG